MEKTEIKRNSDNIDKSDLALARLSRKIREDTQILKSGMKGRTSLLNLQEPQKIYKRILWITVCQQIT